MCTEKGLVPKYGREIARKKTVQSILSNEKKRTARKKKTLVKPREQSHRMKVGIETSKKGCGSRRR